MFSPCGDKKKDKEKEVGHVNNHTEIVRIKTYEITTTERNNSIREQNLNAAF